MLLSECFSRCFPCCNPPLNDHARTQKKLDKPLPDPLHTYVQHFVETRSSDRGITVDHANSTRDLPGRNKVDQTSLHSMSKSDAAWVESHLLCKPPLMLTGLSCTALPDFQDPAAFEKGVKEVLARLKEKYGAQFSNLKPDVLVAEFDKVVGLNPYACAMGPGHAYVTYCPNLTRIPLALLYAPGYHKIYLHGCTGLSEEEKQKIAAIVKDLDATPLRRTVVFAQSETSDCSHTSDSKGGCKPPSDIENLPLDIAIQPNPSNLTIGNVSKLIAETHRNHTSNASHTADNNRPSHVSQKKPQFEVSSYLGMSAFGQSKEGTSSEFKQITTKKNEQQETFSHQGQNPSDKSGPIFLSDDSLSIVKSPTRDEQGNSENNLR